MCLELECGVALQATLTYASFIFKENLILSGNSIMRVSGPWMSGMTFRALQAPAAKPD